MCVCVKKIDLVLRIYEDENDNDNKKQYCNDNKDHPRNHLQLK